MANQYSFWKHKSVVAMPGIQLWSDKKEAEIQLEGGCCQGLQGVSHAALWLWGLRYNALQYIPARGPATSFGSPDLILLARMQSLLTFVLSCLLLAFAAGARADIYSDVNRLVLAEEWSKAQSQAEQHLKTQPTDPQMRLLLSRIQDGQGQTQAAMETLDGLTQSFPELPEPHNNLAALLARQKRYAEALVALQAAVRARPDYATALENLGDVYVALAIQAYQSALQAPPQAQAQPRAASKKRAAEQLLQSPAP